MPNIAIIWDFDGTLTPEDSTTKVVGILNPKQDRDFWKYVKSLRGDLKKPKWEHVLASDAPIWMYSLSKIAYSKEIPLNKEFFKFVAPHIHLYENVLPFLRKIRLIEERKFFQDVDLKINFFVVTAGLKELVELIFPNDLIKMVFGCRYKIIISEEGEIPESIPVFCMDETMKTRSLFEISKGSFLDENKQVNDRVSKDELWAPFDNIIYVGDGFSDVPAFSLVRSKGGVGIAVYDPALDAEKIEEKHKKLRLDKRVDMICPANFDQKSNLYKYISERCEHICFRYHAERKFI